LTLGGILLIGTASVASAQAPSPGATLSTFNGEVAVSRANGTATQPAPNGLTLGVGDRIGTLGRATAIVNFFEGSQIELGWNTTVILREMRSSGSETHVVAELVVGVSTSRTGRFTNPRSDFKIHNPDGEIFALMSGTESPFFKNNAGWVLAGIDKCSNPCGSVFGQGKEYMGPGAWLFSPGFEVFEIPLDRVYEGIYEIQDEEEKEKKEEHYDIKLASRSRPDDSGNAVDPFTVAGSLLVAGTFGWSLYGHAARRRRP
jgi:hypothetical protein